MTHIELLLDTYWDLSYKEGQDNRTHDTENGDAQLVRSAIEREFGSLQATIRTLERQLEYQLNINRHLLDKSIKYPLAIDTQEHGL